MNFKLCRKVVTSTKLIVPLLERRQNKNIWVKANSFTFKKQANFFKKVVGNRSSKKKFYFQSPDAEQNVLHQPTTGLKKKPAKRISVLNKLFMKNISDVIADRPIVEVLEEKSFEITRVEVSPDYKNVNVFWHSADEEIVKIEEALEKETPEIRHELSQLKIVGVIPHIKFIRDKKCAGVNEIFRLLSEADMGDPDEPLGNEIPCETEEPLPEMSNNVFGLNHSLIYERIMNAKKKAQAHHRFKSKENDIVDQPVCS